MIEHTKAILISVVIFLSINLYSQSVIEYYEPLKNDSIRIGEGSQDFMPYIQKGYTLMIPENEEINGIAILLEDSGYDNKNNNSKEMYIQASNRGIAILSVSTEIPFDFYFSNNSIETTHSLITEVFSKHNLPNKNVFFLGASLVGHRAMRYIKFMKENKDSFQLDIAGIIICNFTLDWTRKWHQHERDIRINQINLWEPKFMNYMLESYLEGTPENSPERYYEFSPYSFFDKKLRNIPIFKNYAVRAYIKPDIEYRLKKYNRTLYENNSTDVISFLAELKLAGNEKTELIVLGSEENLTNKINSQSTWSSINKDEMLDWILKQIKN